MDRSAREEELQIEVERLKMWLYKIKNEAWKETRLSVIEWLAEQAISYSNCACHPHWGPSEEWAKLGVWPPCRIEPPDTGPQPPATEETP